MSEKVPTAIVDKNGKATTVHRNVDGSASVDTGRAASLKIVASDRGYHEVQLTDGNTIDVPTELLEDFRGKVEGQYGNIYLVVNSGLNTDPNDEYLISLTDCCNATGKGMDYDTGVGCRSCYNEVESIHAGRINPQEVVFAA